MNIEDIELIRGCLPAGRTKYHYFKSRYIWHILAWYLGNRDISVNSLKKHPFWHRYIRKPQFVDFLRQLPDGMITRDALLGYWPVLERTYPFRLTLGTWGSSKRKFDHEWYQTSRAGWNLVLQLNFQAAHDYCYNSLFADQDHQTLFGWSGHPSRFGEVNTMAWSRMDIDMDSGTALIEEIQTDWLRDAISCRNRLKTQLELGDTFLNSTYRNTTVGRLIDYCERFISPLLKVWDEAMLTATLWFLHEELGIKKIYMHTWKSGLIFKRLDEVYGPPRSLYTKLPKKFGFAYCPDGPSFLAVSKTKSRKLQKKIRNSKPLNWWLLDLDSTINQEARETNELLL